MAARKKKPFAKASFDEIALDELETLSDTDIEKQHKQMVKVRDKFKEAPVEPRPTSNIERVPTGIPGFDELIEGGLERDSTVLVIGGAGTGKTTLVLQYLYNGAVRYKHPGVFLSFEEPREKLYKHMQVFGWDFAELEKKKLFTYLQYAPHQVEKIMEEGGGTIRDAIEDMEGGSPGTVRFGMDSLTSFITMFHNEYEARENVVRFIENLADWNCTSLVTVEPRHVSPDTPSTEIGVEFMVDGVIALYMIKSGDRRETALEVLKMRATKHLRKICPYKFDRAGIVVYPKETIFGAKLF
ncbi:MAG: AAA family ATPase [Candidatus Diapherotrites archaeon]|nr:AAA family ATPase [Candidatus Diapherotrites archaeon]